MAAAPLARGTLSFDAKATLGDFVGTTETMKGEMAATGPLSTVTGWVEAPVGTLKTRNDRRDRDLNKSMETDKIPTMRFDLSAVNVHWERGDSALVALVGAFTIHGVKRDATFDALVVHQPAGVRVTGTVPMNLKDYSIGGLSKFLGTLKMHPDIVVHVDLLFGAPGSTPAPSPPA